MARTAGSHLFVAALVGAAITCGRPRPPDPVSAEVDAVLAGFGPNVVEPALADALTAGQVLAERIGSWRVADDTDTALQSAQDAWRDTLAAWQVVELLQVGPAASAPAAGADDLRDAIYSWPTVNRCRVDQITVQGGWDAPDFFDTNLVVAYGLDALEVLLFSPPAENGCAPQVDINTDGSWDALGVDGIAAARASYAEAVAERLVTDLQRLAEAWDPTGGNFGAVLADGAAPFGGKTEALNAILDALLYLETFTKDQKLAGPLGLADCTGDVCLDAVESPLAGESHRWVQINLTAFRTAFEGGNGKGLDDLLRIAGHPDVADAMAAALDDAQAAALALDVPIEVAATDDPEAALAAHDAIDGVVDLLKSDVAVALVLTVPDDAAGDND